MSTVIDRKTKYNPVPLDTKAEILQDADLMIRDGYTLHEIAEKHGISDKTLDIWLADITDQDITRQWTNARLAKADQLIDQAIEYANRDGLTREEVAIGQLRLQCARARALQSNFIAERRDARYAAKQEAATVHINLVPPALQQSAMALLDAITVPNEPAKIEQKDS